MHGIPIVPAKIKIGENITMSTLSQSWFLLVHSFKMRMLLLQNMAPKISMSTATMSWKIVRKIVMGRDIQRHRLKGPEYHTKYCSIFWSLHLHRGIWDQMKYLVTGYCHCMVGRWKTWVGCYWSAVGYERHWQKEGRPCLHSNRLGLCWWLWWLWDKLRQFCIDSYLP